jgi:hypothetical protein
VVNQVFIGSVTLLIRWVYISPDLAHDARQLWMTGHETRDVNLKSTWMARHGTAWPTYLVLINGAQYSCENFNDTWHIAWGRLQPCLGNHCSTSSTCNHHLALNHHKATLLEHNSNCCCELISYSKITRNYRNPKTIFSMVQLHNRQQMNKTECSYLCEEKLLQT